MNRTSLLAAALALTFALTGCGSGQRDNELAAMANAAVAAGFKPPAAPDTSPASQTPLSAYVGRYPTEKVDNVAFLDRDEVRAAVAQAVPHDSVPERVLDDSGPKTPVFTVDGRFAAWGCEADRCASHNWTVFVDPDGRANEVCYRDSPGRGANARWFRNGLVELRTGICPSKSASC